MLRIFMLRKQNSSMHTLSTGDLAEVRPGCPVLEGVPLQSQRLRTAMLMLVAGAVSLTGALTGADAGASDAPAPLKYNRDIRPILADACFACHGMDAAARQADLRLDDRDSAIESGAIEPGKPDRSDLVARILTDDPETLMPPPKSHKVLTAEQKAILQRWIAEGAEYEPHWAFVPPARPELPVVKNEGWVRQPLDRFILNRLESEGLEPAPEADLETLARRAALDVTGLPPTPEQLAELRADTSASAYENYVNRLLERPEWGEHRGRYWLDYARYADTHGIHFDNYREMWAYRDWVIHAFNTNMPYDQFTVEQLAGDLLPEPTLDQRVATGFNRCNITTNEGGVIPEEYVVLYARDRTETTASVFLGLTAGCAVCHDHKLDPLTQQEFYSLSAFFNNTTQNPMDGNIKDTPPIIPVPQLEDRPRVDALKASIAQQQQQQAELREQLRAPFEQWTQQPQLADSFSWDAVPSDGLVAHLPLAEGGGEFLNVFAGGRSQRVPVPAGAKWDAGYVSSQAWVNSTESTPALPHVGDFERDAPFSFGAWIRVPRGAGGSVFARMDEGNEHRGWDLWLQGDRVAVHLVHAWPKDALKVLANDPLPADQWAHVMVTYDGSSTVDGLNIFINGKLQGKQSEARELKNSIRTTTPLVIGRRSQGANTPGVRVQDLRLYNRALAQDEIDQLRMRLRTGYLVAKHAPRSSEEQAELYEMYLAQHNPEFQRLSQSLAAARSELERAMARGTIAHVMQERSDTQPLAYILFRGEYDKRRDQVSVGTPAFLPPLPEELPRNRLGLAQWLIRPDNPLMARVTVNRFWQEVFGTGIVRTSGDFGTSGELPSHPELLDYLAVDFRETGWDVKGLFRQILTSATYRQSAQVTPVKLEKDRDNRLLSRGPRYRMDAEMVRDYALASTGLLVRKLGGPSVRPYQPPGVWEAVAMIGSNTRDYREDEGENVYRRSLYTFWKRSAPPASMDIFNAPSRENCTVRRERTNTPLQALVTLNDVQFVEAAKGLAAQVLAQADDDQQRLDQLTDRLLGRPLKPEERNVVLESLATLRSLYRDDSAAANELLGVGRLQIDSKLPRPELAAWTMLTNQLMNLDEVLTK
jgi:hypothetical protein